MTEDIERIASWLKDAFRKSKFWTVFMAIVICLFLGYIGYNGFIGEDVRDGFLRVLDKDCEAEKFSEVEISVIIDGVPAVRGESYLNGSTVEIIKNVGADTYAGIIWISDSGIQLIDGQPKYFESNTKYKSSHILDDVTGSNIIYIVGSNCHFDFTHDFENLIRSTFTEYLNSAKGVEPDILNIKDENFTFDYFEFKQIEDL